MILGSTRLLGAGKWVGALIITGVQILAPPRTHWNDFGFKQSLNYLAQFACLCKKQGGAFIYLTPVYWALVMWHIHVGFWGASDDQNMPMCSLHIMGKWQWRVKQSNNLFFTKFIEESKWKSDRMWEVLYNHEIKVINDGDKQKRDLEGCV